MSEDNKGIIKKKPEHPIRYAGRIDGARL